MARAVIAEVKRILNECTEEVKVLFKKNYYCYKIKPGCTATLGDGRRERLKDGNEIMVEGYL